MGSLLLSNARAVVTMDDGRRVHAAADVLCVGPRIAALGPGLKRTDNCEVIDCTDKVVLPGLINAHHHLYQTLTRAVPAVACALAMTVIASSRCRGRHEELRMTGHTWGNTPRLPAGCPTARPVLESRHHSITGRYPQAPAGP